MHILYSNLPNISYISHVRPETPKVSVKKIMLGVEQKWHRLDVQSVKAPQITVTVIESLSFNVSVNQSTDNWHLSSADYSLSEEISGAWTLFRVKDELISCFTAFQLIARFLSSIHHFIQYLLTCTVDIIIASGSTWEWVSEWVSSFLMAHQHTRGHSVPFRCYKQLPT